MNLRNHRKLQIIDGGIGFVGGMNIGREYAGETQDPRLWRDAQIEVRGPGRELSFRSSSPKTGSSRPNEIFTGGDDYLTPNRNEGSLCQVIAGGPDLPGANPQIDHRRPFGFARQPGLVHYRIFCSGHLFLTRAPIMCCPRVDVRLFVSRRSDHPYLVLRSGDPTMKISCAWGVRVFEFSKGINHNKAMLTDDEWLMVGSANSDNRSLRLDFELNLLVHSMSTWRMRSKR